jgi:hypothetical protein
MNESGARVLASGATELWAENVRSGHRMERLGDAALEAERPFHVAQEGASLTLCGTKAENLREYPIEFAAQEARIRCPVCDEKLGHPTSTTRETSPG